ncbi:SRPBCC domain-containing protein [Streptomyces sp. NPDC127190]|uniref:SRPBCC domain-containing protein n=1 Tax=unclassified Streptomyces TaxID=2593676 RepID=UPI003631839B
MEHQVFTPVPAERLRAALADPARVARAVPGFQQDPGATPLTGRLKLRVGGHSVTYRGAARIAARPDGTYRVEAEAGEARGTGSVELAVTLRLADTDGGTTVTASGTATVTGRLTELPQEAVTSATTRLLTRFLHALSEAPDTPTSDTSGADAPEAEVPAVDAEASFDPADDHLSVFDAEIPPPALAAEADADDAFEAGQEGQEDEEDGVDDGEVDEAELEDRLSGVFADSGEPPAEAAHARRTMIGRSAEEVDHAPPRGRYAPVPAPQTVAGNPALRWAAPAAALALASAIVVGRALRKRH